MHSRRDFLVTGGATLAVYGMSGGIRTVEAATAAALPTGRIVEVSTNEMLKAERPIKPLAQKMLERALQEFTGKSKLADAWSTVVSAKDKVGIKINCLGKPKMSTTPEVVDCIIEGLRAAGVKDDQIVVFDNFGSHMRMSRFPLVDKKGAVHYVHNKMAGFEDEWRTHPSGKTKFAKVLLEMDKIISVPVIKDHALSGVTCALKNMAFGTIINPSAHHRNACDPGIANVYSLAPIRDKVALIVLDGAYMQYDGGPQFNAAARIPFNRVMVTQDPVALDKLAWELIDEQRKGKGKPPLHKGRAKPTHVATAAGLKLGTDDRAKIKVVKKTVS